MTELQKTGDTMEARISTLIIPRAEISVSKTIDEGIRVEAAQYGFHASSFIRSDSFPGTVGTIRAYKSRARSDERDCMNELQTTGDTMEARISTLIIPRTEISVSKTIDERPRLKLRNTAFMLHHSYFLLPSREPLQPFGHISPAVDQMKETA
jgi:hypothetical protein